LVQFIISVTASEIVLRAAALRPRSAFSACACPIAVSLGSEAVGGGSVGATVDAIGAVVVGVVTLATAAAGGAAFLLESFAQPTPARATTTTPTIAPARMARLRFGERGELPGGGDEGGVGATDAAATGAAAMAGGRIVAPGGAGTSSGGGAGIGAEGAAALTVPQFTQNLAAGSIGSPQFTQKRLVFVWFIGRFPYSWSIPAITQ
jgi:hypothetical protein